VVFEAEKQPIECQPSQFLSAMQRHRKRKFVKYGAKLAILGRNLSDLNSYKISDLDRLRQKSSSHKNKAQLIDYQRVGLYFYALVREEGVEPSHLVDIGV
jgi:hypothetical protein